jgi:hypothetical protein
MRTIRTMETTANGWNVLDRAGAVLWREYSFGPALATTLVFRGAGDGLVVISPANNLDSGALDELKDFGNVVALVASNGFHWLGHPSWRKQFPQARSFSPAQGIARIAKKLPDLGPFESLDALAPLVGAHASVVDAPGYKMGNAFAMIRGKGGTYWYPSDLMANMPKLPANFVFRTLMSLTSSAPGYRLFRPAVWLGVKDKQVVRSWIDDEFAKAAPTTVVPAHGPPTSGSDLVATTKALLAKM